VVAAAQERRVTRLIQAPPEQIGRGFLVRQVRLTLEETGPLVDTVQISAQPLFFKPSTRYLVLPMKGALERAHTALNYDRSGARLKTVRP
jgi:hypothetical protein